jgi:hypothetical protein
MPLEIRKRFYKKDRKIKKDLVFRNRGSMILRPTPINGL